MTRYGMVIRLKPDRVTQYRRLHADVWPGVLDAMRRNGWRNFDIFLKEPENLLFGTFEYHGSDFAAAARAIGADPETQRWLRETDPCQEPFATRRPGEWWAYMDNIFHMD
ncbi:MAG: L-rhamnose mutarotase [Rhodobacter sp.]|nr:L-rhamnose mutarotase [Rhodobacter sp.]